MSYHWPIENRYRWFIQHNKYGTMEHLIGNVIMCCKHNYWHDESVYLWPDDTTCIISFATKDNKKDRQWVFSALIKTTPEYEEWKISGGERSFGSAGLCMGTDLRATVKFDLTDKLDPQLTIKYPSDRLDPTDIKKIEDLL